MKRPLPETAQPRMGDDSQWYEGPYHASLQSAEAILLSMLDRENSRILRDQNQMLNGIVPKGMSVQERRNKVAAYWSVLCSLRVEMNHTESDLRLYEKMYGEEQDA